MDLFEKRPGKMMEIIQLLFREIEEGMEFLSLEDNKNQGDCSLLSDWLGCSIPQKIHVSYVYSNLNVNNGIMDNKVI